MCFEILLRHTKTEFIILLCIHEIIIASVQDKRTHSLILHPLCSRYVGTGMKSKTKEQKHD